MRVLAALMFLVALGVLAVVAWPLLRPLDRPGSSRTAPIPIERTQVVSGDAATPAADPDAPAPSAPPRGPASAPDAPAGPLCDRAPDGSTAEVLSLPPGPTLRPGPRVRGPAWTWVNLWAAWCKPCKEEMPLLSAWAAARRDRGTPLRVLFLSVDDDERQLARYLDDQGRTLPDEVRWVRDESARSRFYRALGIADPPTLPVQVLLDPQGRLRCLRAGSITPRDLDEAARRFGW